MKICIFLLFINFIFITFEFVKSFIMTKKMKLVSMSCKDLFLKKKFLFGIISLLFISPGYSKILINYTGKLSISKPVDSNADPNWSIEISCLGDKYTNVNGIWFVEEHDTVSINYDEALLGGGDRSGSECKRTRLSIYTSEGIILGNEFTVTKGITYFINIIIETSSSYNFYQPSQSITFSQKIIAFNDYFKINEKDFGVNCTGEIVTNTNLKLKCYDAFPKDNNWYVKKSSPVDIIYNNSYEHTSWSSSNDQLQTGSGGEDEKYTELRITEDNKVTYKSEKGKDNIFTKNITANTKIELYNINMTANSGSGIKITESFIDGINIILDSEPPLPPIITGLSEAWTNKNIEITLGGSTDTVSGMWGYEYKVGESEWQNGSTCAVTAAEGQIVETEVKFHAVDNVGNASEEVTATVKIDRTKPVIRADKESGKWTKEDIKIQAEDTGSGFRRLEIRKDGILYNPAVENTLSESGRYTVKAADNAGNESDEVTYLIDKTKPQIELDRYEEGVWTNKDVTIKFTDEHSGIKSVTVNGSAAAYENGYAITESGEYTVKCIDKTGNENSAAVKVDKIKPEVSALSFSGFGYEKEGETEYLNGYDVKYKVTEEDSGISRNQLYLNGVKVNESTEKELTYRESQNISKLSRTERDERCEYKVLLTDNAGNESVEKKASLTIPRTIILKTVEKEDENQGLRKSYIKDGYTINGILINKINFDLYKEIRLKRTFLADKPEGQNRKEFCYEEYKSRFGGSVREEEIKRNWEECAQTVITKADVRKVTIGGEEYWYYEDKIKTESGLGHRGIRYQAEWDWKALGVTEKGEYVTEDKTANKPGRVKIRIQGTDVNGEGIKYVVLDGEGKRIEEESDADFTVPVSGVIRLAVKIEDEDFDDYSIEATELVKAVFMKGSEQSEGTLTVAMEGASAEGYIVKTNENGMLKSQFRLGNTGAGGWHEFANPEVKLYYNKPFNMKITMTEGCNGASGAYKDVTESGIIRLKAGNPDIGGFRLLVGEEAGYNEDGITARPHQEIELGIEFSGDGENADKIEWNYGDGEQSEGSSIKHTYVQSPERNGNTSEYVLRIKTGSGENEKRAAVNVHIVDTQYGMLLGDEEWIGAHPVLGRIQVPENVTLSVKENREENNNATVILGYGSALEERKGVIEILKGGKLYVNTQGVKFTEGKNGTTFTEVKTEKEGGEDESLKWGGIVIRGGSEASYIKNVEIKYAVNGITAEEGSVLTARNIEIKECSVYGLKAGGEVKAGTIVIEGVKNGLYISKDGKVNVEEKVRVQDCEKGIGCDGALKAGKIEMDEISEKGISIKGRTESLGGIEVNGSGKCGIETCEGSELTCGSDIRVQGFEEGIRNKGAISAGRLKIKTNGTRGYVSGSGSRSKFGQTQIEGGEIGIHCMGNAEAEFGKSEVSADKYGIKTDRDEKGGPSIKFAEGSIIDKATVLWYDWERGVLTEEETEEKMKAE